MRIQLVSDLHMEFAPIEIVNPGADVLVLSGDIMIAERFTRSEASPYSQQAELWKLWMEIVCSQYEHVFYVLGNHEHYYGKFYETAEILRSAFAHISNLQILDNNDTLYDGVLFVGTTLWTDFDRDNFKVMLVRDGLNDYKLIEGKDYRKITPAETVVYHDYALRLIDAQCKDHEKVIVLGHHAPSYRSVVDEYLYGRWAHLNPGYCSHLDSFIESHPQIRLWTHGHVHSSHDYVIGDTRVVANPRGYALKTTGQENADFNPKLILEV